MTDWLDEMPYDPPRPKQGHEVPNPLSTLAGMATWLSDRKRLEWLRKSDLALSFHDEIKVTVERARIIIDRPQDREATVPVGTHADCGGQINGHLPTEESRLSVWGDCDVCEARWEASEFSGLWRQMRPDATLRPMWVSTVQAASTLGVSDRMVRKWVDTGRIESEKRNRGQRRVIMVRQSDVVRLRRERECA